MRIQTIKMKATTQQTDAYSKSTVEKSFGVFMVSFDHVSQLILVFLVLTLNMYLFARFFPQQISKIYVLNA